MSELNYSVIEGCLLSNEQKPERPKSFSYGVSILLPVWNHGGYVETIIRNIKLEQTFMGDIDLIVFEDKSTDNTREKLIDLQAAYGFRLMLNDINMGQIGCLNHGMKIAKHDVCMTMNADDMLMPGCLKIMYDEIVNNGSSAVGARTIQKQSCEMDSPDQYAGLVAEANANSTMERRVRTPDDIRNLAKNVSLGQASINDLIVSGATFTYIKDYALKIGGYFSKERRCSIHDDRDFEYRYGVNFGITEIEYVSLIWRTDTSTGGTTRH